MVTVAIRPTWQSGKSTEALNSFHQDYIKSSFHVSMSAVWCSWLSRILNSPALRIRSWVRTSVWSFLTYLISIFQRLFHILSAMRRTKRNDIYSFPPGRWFDFCVRTAHDLENANFPRADRIFWVWNTMSIAGTVNDEPFDRSDGCLFYLAIDVRIEKILNHAAFDKSVLYLFCP